MGKLLVVALVVAILSCATVGLRVTGNPRVTGRVGGDAILRIKATPDKGETIEDVIWALTTRPRNQLNTPKYARYTELSDGSLKISGLKKSDKGAYTVKVYQTDGNKPSLKMAIFYIFLDV